METSSNPIPILKCDEDQTEKLIQKPIMSSNLSERSIVESKLHKLKQTRVMLEVRKWEY